MSVLNWHAVKISDKNYKALEFLAEFPYGRIKVIYHGHEANWEVWMVHDGEGENKGFKSKRFDSKEEAMRAAENYLVEEMKTFLKI